MKKIKLPDRYSKMINEATEKILRESAKIFAKDYRNQYRSIILDFYKDYPRPRRYDRTLETQNANSIRENNYDYKKTFVFLNPTTIQFKFSVGSDYIQGTPYRADTDWVFNRTYFKGIHGWTPDEVMSIPNRFLGGYGYDSKRHDRFLNMVHKWNNVPDPMDPPPATLMDEFHINYKKASHLRELLQPLSRKIMDEILSE